MTQETGKSVMSRTRVALIGGSEEGLLTLACLTQDPSTEVVLLIDQDQKALAFRLHEYGFTFDKIFAFSLSSDIHELKRIKDLDYIIDASGDPAMHQALYRLNHPKAEIMAGQCARILWEIKLIPFRGSSSRDGLDLEETDGSLSKRQTVLKQKGGGLLTAFTGTLPPEEIINFNLDALLYTVEADWSALYLENDPGGDLVCKGRRLMAAGKEKAVSEFRQKPDLAGLIASRVKHHRSFLFLEPPFQDPWTASLMENLKLQQYLAIPLFEQDRFIGILEFGNITGQTFWTANEAEFIEQWVSQQEFKNLLLTFRKPVNLLEPLLRTLRGILESSKPPHENLDEAVGEIGVFSGASAVLLFVKDPESGDLVLQSQIGSSLKMNGMYRMAPEAGICGAALQKGSPLAFMETDGRTGFHDPMGIFYFPLMVQSHPVGILILEFQRLAPDPQKWKSDFLEAADLLAASISGEVERRTMSQKVLKLTVVNEEGLELVSTTDRDKVLMMASASAAMIVEAEGVILRIKEKEGGRLLVGYTYGLQNEPGDKLLIQVDAVLAARVAESRKPLMSSSLKELASIKEKLTPKFPYHSILSIPLMNEEEVVGTLSVYNKVIYNSFVTAAFNETDKELIEKYGGFVSKALVKAKEFQSREKLITIDDLTGLKNERYLLLRFPEELKRAERYKRKLSLLFLDIDRTKKEFAGLPLVIQDHLAQNIARLIQENFRHVDITVRVKGTRFAVLLPDTGKKMGDTLVRLHQALEALILFNQNNVRLPLQLLIGYSTYPEDTVTMEELIQKAARLSPFGV
jgi:diguanylate cyclase (GGDEF)-like protein